MKTVTLNYYCARCGHRWDSYPSRASKCPICNNPAKERKAKVEIDQQDIAMGVKSE